MHFDLLDWLEIWECGIFRLPLDDSIYQWMYRYNLVRELSHRSSYSLLKNNNNNNINCRLCSTVECMLIIYGASNLKMSKHYTIHTVVFHSIIIADILVGKQQVVLIK